VGLETLEDLEAVAQHTLASASASDTGARAAAGANALGEESLGDARMDDLAADSDDDVYADSASESDSPDFEDQASAARDAEDGETEADDVVPLRAGPPDTERSE
jgi:hypothetical protein